MRLVLTRRAVLLGSGAGSAALAGCAGGSGGADTDGTTAGGGAGASGTDAGDTGTAAQPDETTGAPASTTMTDETTQGAQENENGQTTSVSTDGGDSGSDLDLREANVTDVAFEARGDGEYRFDVTLYHDDDGEDGYANWWDVETLDGERLGRRELLHAHSTAPFTRSTTIEVPAGTTCVVVRGHDQTHGFGGQVMLVDLETGALRAVQQGEERQSFGAADCP